jgi:hypothetical protein
MIERAIGIDFIKKFKQPPITDDTLADCESNEDTPIKGIIDDVKTNGDDIVDSAFEGIFVEKPSSSGDEIPAMKLYGDEYASWMDHLIHMP